MTGHYPCSLCGAMLQKGVPQYHHVCSIKPLLERLDKLEKSLAEVLAILGREDSDGNRRVYK